MTRGFLLGKFMPPHAGHQLLIETAAALVDELTVLLCSLPDDPIPGTLRLAWLREMFPTVMILHHTAVVPQEPHEHPDFWTIWRSIVQAAHPQPIDFVFASEAYGARLAEEVGARFWPVDPPRTAEPVSACAIRTNPFAHWEMLPPPVCAYYAHRICLHGPESTGKSTLATALATHFDTLLVPEFGRTYCEEFRTDLTLADLVSIGRGHDAMTKSLVRRANRLLIVDTDPLMTAVWADMLFARRDPWFDAWGPPADLYLLLELDLPWIDDGTRMFGSTEDRARFMALSEAELVRRGVRYTRVGGVGEARLANALSAIDDAGLASFAPIA